MTLNLEGSICISTSTERNGYQNTLGKLIFFFLIDKKQDVKHNHDNYAECPNNEVHQPVKLREDKAEGGRKGVRSFDQQTKKLLHYRGESSRLWGSISCCKLLVFVRDICLLSWYQLFTCRKTVHYFGDLLAQIERKLFS